MKDLRGKALAAVSAENLYRKFKLGEFPAHQVKAKKLRAEEAMVEFDNLVAELMIRSRERADILKWAQEVVAAREEIGEVFRNNPASKLRRLLTGFGEFWGFGDYPLLKITVAPASIYSYYHVNQLIKFLHSSPNLQDAIEALAMLSGLVENWSLSLLVNAKVVLEKVKKMQQGSFSKQEVIQILEGLINQSVPEETDEN